MKQITIISGKGGTGKTTLTAGLAYFAENKVMADCDVDAADLHLLLNPRVEQKHDFFSGQKYEINSDLCTQCGKCRERCRYDAISHGSHIDPISCEGCGACYFVCPGKAINRSEKLAGEYYISSTKYGPFVHANLHIAEDNSGKLVAQVRKEALKIAAENQAEHIIIDGPPGIGCPVNASLVGANLALVITEPTLSGIHDLERVLHLTKHFKITTRVVINKYDINQENTTAIRTICNRDNAPCIAVIPYNQDILKAVIAGKVFPEAFPGHEVARTLKNIWEEIKNSD
ncbi:MAG: ATP-binding protein [Candidatus Margulisiibacteriota bacterium]